MNQYVASRLDGIHSILCSAFEAGVLLSAASKGYERETFISLFLSEVFPTIYRFGSGDITDSIGKDAARKSGQIDIVIEMPWAPSFPTPIGSGPRLYPAEAVGAAIEIKSDLVNQWDEVVQTANTLEPLRQKLSGITVDGGSLSIENETEEPVPFYAVGYEGWSTPTKVEGKARGAPVDGVLVLKHKIFAWSDRRAYFRRLTQCQVELAKKCQGEPFNAPLAACAKIVELKNTNALPGDIVRVLNAEEYSSTPVHFGDHQFMPTVDVGSWSEQTLQDTLAVFEQKTGVSVGVEALLQFVNILHQEVGKRAAMSFDLSGYAT